MGEDAIFENGSLAVFGDYYDSFKFYIIDSSGAVIDSGSKEDMIKLASKVYKNNVK
jgi:hypothetical protein